jgi:hypothetical protein
MCQGSHVQCNYVDFKEGENLQCNSWIGHGQKGQASSGVISLAIIKALTQSLLLTYPKPEA